MRIKVFTDMRFTSHPHQTGVGKHIRHMVRGLASVPGNNLSLLVSSDQLADHASGSLRNLRLQTLPLKWKSAEALWTLTGIPSAHRDIGECDWVYCPKNDFIPTKCQKVAVTVHGAHELDPDYPFQFGVMSTLNRGRRWLSYRRVLDQATLIFSVSAFLSEQIVSWFGIPAEKVIVVGNGVEQPYFDAQRQPLGCSRRRDFGQFILCVGGLNFLDGGDRILDLANALRKRGSGLRVVLAGSCHDPALLALATQHSNLELLHHVPAETLSLLMRDALALYYPTRYETFGIAAAEAMAAGTPVVTNKTTAIPEIVGEAGIYINPDDFDQAASVLCSLCGDEAYRDFYINLGRKRAVGYSWSACVQRLQEALRKNARS